MIAMSEYVRALDGLREESEDVVDNKDGMGSVGGPSHVGLESVDGDVGSFGLTVWRSTRTGRMRTWWWTDSLTSLWQWQEG